MKVLELFSGTRSIGKAFEARGHEVFSIDFDRRFLANAHCDIETLTTEQVLEWFGKPDVIWASPDCATFSMAAISHHREKDPATGALLPKTEYAAKCDRTDAHVIELIRDLVPRYWFIENPRGGDAQNAVDARPPPLHGHLLPVRGQAPEAHGHLDEPSRPAIQATLQARFTMPRASPARLSNGNAGHQGQP